MAYESNAETCRIIPGLRSHEFGLVGLEGRSLQGAGGLGLAPPPGKLDFQVVMLWLLPATRYVHVVVTSPSHGVIGQRSHGTLMYCLNNKAKPTMAATRPRESPLPATKCTLGTGFQRGVTYTTYLQTTYCHLGHAGPTLLVADVPPSRRSALASCDSLSDADESHSSLGRNGSTTFPSPDPGTPTLSSTANAKRIVQQHICDDCI
jgi:hypothetical protein